MLGKFLLTGMLRCTCGASFEAQTTPHGKWHKGGVYVCSAHRRKGPAVCANRLALPIEETDDRILNAIEGQVLQPMLIEAVLRTVFVADEADRPALEAERDELERQMENLTAAVKAGGDIPLLVAELKKTNARLVELRRQLEPQEHRDREQLRAALEQRVDEWRTILRANAAQAHQVLVQVLGPIAITIEGAILTEAPLEGFDVRDRRGKEGITLDDVREGLAEIRWNAATKPSGLLAGLSLDQALASPMPAQLEPDRRLASADRRPPSRCVTLAGHPRNPYSSHMSPLRARVQKGRLVLNEPTTLPEGTVVDLVVDDEGDDLTDEERRALHDALSASWESAESGRLRPASAILDELRRRR